MQKQFKGKHITKWLIYYLLSQYFLENYFKTPQFQLGNINYLDLSGILHVTRAQG